MDKYEVTVVFRDDRATQVIPDVVGWDIGGLSGFAVLVLEDHVMYLPIDLIAMVVLPNLGAQ